jgi:hypothetical protein
MCYSLNLLSDSTALWFFMSFFYPQWVKLLSSISLHDAEDEIDE